MTDSSYCVRCKQHTHTVSGQISHARNGRKCMRGRCAVCHGGKVKFMSGKGFLGALKKVGKAAANYAIPAIADKVASYVPIPIAGDLLKYGANLGNDAIQGLGIRRRRRGQGVTRVGGSLAQSMHWPAHGRKRAASRRGGSIFSDIGDFFSS